MSQRLLERIAQLEKAAEHAIGQAESANEAKNIFLSTLSHELRTPLTSILAWSQLLKMGDPSREELKRGLDSIEQNARAQSQLINDLLDLSRIQAGTISFTLADVSATDIVQSAVHSLQPMASSKNVTFELYVGESFVGEAFIGEPAAGAALGKVRVDPTRVSQVLWHLLTNALKFSLVGGKVEVRLGETRASGRDYISIRIVDHGKGIDAEFLPHLFTRFRQEDSSSTRLHNGLGIGLALVSDLVRLLNGIVTAESQGAGKGSTFTVLLPQAPVAAEQPRTATEQACPDLSGLDVLLIDDEPSALEVFTQLVDAFGGSAKACSSVRAAMAEFEKHHYDVVVSDIAMPVEDGFALIQQIRSLPPEKGGRVPAIAVTAFTADHDVARTAAAGFQKHMAKPIDALELGRTIALLAQNARTTA